MPPQGNGAHCDRLEFDKQVTAATQIARTSGLLQEGQGLQLVSASGLASCFMHISDTAHIDKCLVII